MSDLTISDKETCDILAWHHLTPEEQSEFDWAEVERLSSEGRIAGRISGGSLTVDGRVYFYLGE